LTRIKRYPTVIIRKGALMILETIRNWFGWRRKIPDPFLTVTIPPGVRYFTYTIGRGGGGGGESAGSGFSRDDSDGGRGGGRGGDLIVVKYHGSTMWPADDDSG
jgi:hypothetical protein